MGKAARAAVTLRGFLIIEKSEGIGAAASRRDAEVLEERFADEMRRPPTHGPDADVDARLAVVDRRKLRMRIGDVENANVAEGVDVVDVIVGADPDARHDARAR